MVFLGSSTPGQWAVGEFWGPLATETPLPSRTPVSMYVVTPAPRMARDTKSASPGPLRRTS